MKKLLTTIVSVWVLGVSTDFAQAQTITSQPQAVRQDTSETLYRDFLLTMLSPYISKAIDTYYKDTGRNFAISQIQIKDLKRLSEKGQFHFEITVEVPLFTGAHNATNEVDTITLTTFPPSKAFMPQKLYEPNIYILRFEHRDVKPTQHVQAK